MLSTHFRDKKPLPSGSEQSVNKFATECTRRGLMKTKVSGWPQRQPAEYHPWATTAQRLRNFFNPKIHWLYLMFFSIKCFKKSFKWEKLVQGTPPYTSKKLLSDRSERYQSRTGIGPTYTLCQPQICVLKRKKKNPFMVDPWEPAFISVSPGLSHTNQAQIYFLRKVHFKPVTGEV